MAKRCIFCGKEFGLFGGGLIMCGGTDQPVCSDCSGLLSQLSPVERAEKALETGRASEPKELEKFLLREQSRQEREAARIEQARQAIRTDKTCLRCGGPMEKYGMKRFHLGDDGLLGPVARDGLFASWLEVEIIRCAHCGKAEFYLPEPPELPEVEEDMVTCPECGTRHSSLINCPYCAMKRGSASRPENKRRGSRPPWEK